ncbi:30S ribosomal protein S9 [Candidatus Woesearchaeota archaeon]|nr:30S ribosomal protein S9 [Candidatus Woesearchaeota archaeon]
MTDAPTPEKTAEVAVPAAPEKTKKTAKAKSKKLIQTSGKRKRAIARAVLHPGKGIVRINHQRLETITPQLAKDRLMEPLLLAEDAAGKVDIHVHVAGGGWQGQTEAARLAIARALAQFDKKLKKIFLEYDRQLLVADIRSKETRKPNDSKARAARQKSYR